MKYVYLILALFCILVVPLLWKSARSGNTFSAILIGANIICALWDMANFLKEVIK